MTTRKDAVDPVVGEVDQEVEGALKVAVAEVVVALPEAEEDDTARTAADPTAQRIPARKVMKETKAKHGFCIQKITEVGTRIWAMDSRISYRIRWLQCRKLK
jgi:hypothetical protein